MIELLQSFGTDGLIVLAAGVAVVLALRFVRALVDALPMSRARRALAVRIRPFIGAIVVILYLLFVVAWLLRDHPGMVPWALAVLGLGVAAASWPAIRDVLEGAYVRASPAFAVGDRVQIGTVRGRIRRLGYRNVYIEGTDGELAILPYRLIATQPILRSAELDRGAFHVFRVPVPAERSIPELKRQVRESALLNHWSSIARPPQISATADGHVEITVFAIDPDQAPEIERAVRKAIAGG